MVHNLSLGDSAKGCRIVYGITLMPGPEKCKRFMCDADHVRRWDGPSALGVVRGPNPGPVAQAGIGRAVGAGGIRASGRGCDPVYGGVFRRPCGTNWKRGGESRHSRAWLNFQRRYATNHCESSWKSRP